MSEEIPQWAKERAAALANGSRSAERPSRENLPSDCDAFPDMHAFARYIAQHEQPPVDPDVVEARQLIAAVYGMTKGEDGKFLLGEGPRRVDAIARGVADEYWEMRAVLAAIRKHKEEGK